MVLNKEVKLTGTKQEKIKQILQLAGWSDNRCVDISIVEDYYRKNQVQLVDAAKNFFREYYGLAGFWYLQTQTRTKDHGVIVGHGSSTFFLFPRKNWRELKSYTPPGELLYEKLSEDKHYIQNIAKEDVTLVGEMGYYYPAAVWVGTSGNLYAVHDYEPEIVRVFGSLPEFLEHEYQMHDLISVEISL